MTAKPQTPYALQCYAAAQIRSQRAQIDEREAVLIRVRGLIAAARLEHPQDFEDAQRERNNDGIRRSIRTCR